MIDRLTQDILRSELEYWVPLLAIDSLARQLGARDDTDAREMSLAAIRFLVEERLVVIGDVSEQGFRDVNEPLDVALSQIERQWQGLERDEWAFSYWLRNTPAGDARATTR